MLHRATGFHALSGITHVMESGREIWTQKIKITLTGNSCKTISEVYVQFKERQEVGWDNHNTKSAKAILFFMEMGIAHRCSLMYRNHQEEW
jgi:hypothetical protein